MSSGVTLNGLHGVSTTRRLPGWGHERSRLRGGCRADRLFILSHAIGRQSALLSPRLMLPRTMKADANRLGGRKLII